MAKRPTQSAPPASSAAASEGPVAPVVEPTGAAGPAEHEDNHREAQAAGAEVHASAPPADEALWADTLLGSSVLPAILDFGGGREGQLGELVAYTHRVSGLAVEAWNDLPEAIRETMLQEGLTMIRSGVPFAQRILALAAGATDPELVTIEARSRDGKPFRRAGHLFTDAFKSFSVTPDQFELIRADAGILVKAVD